MPPDAPLEEWERKEKRNVLCSTPFWQGRAGTRNDGQGTRFIGAKTGVKTGLMRPGCLFLLADFLDIAQNWEKCQMFFVCNSATSKVVEPILTGMKETVCLFKQY